VIPSYERSHKGWCADQTFSSCVAYLIASKRSSPKVGGCQNLIPIQN